MHRTARRTAVPSLLLALGLAACGGAAEPAASPEAGAAAPSASPAPPRSGGDGAAKEAPEKEGPMAVPTTCETKDGDCLPPARFAKKLCAGFHPDVALAMFAKGTPWTRGYLRMNVDAVNASGGVSSGDKLVFDEEVLVLVRRRADTGGMQVSGAGGGYDVLRWDGTCATLSGEELTTNPPPKPKHPKLKWQDLGDATHAKLLEDETIAKINKDRRRECKGVTIGAVSDKCVKAVDALSLAIVSWVRAGGSVPPPPALP
jgi:hypothetical protein